GVLELERPSPLRPWIVHGYVLLIAYSAYVVLVGGDHPFWYRFYVPLLPLPMLATSQLDIRIANQANHTSIRRVPPLIQTWLAGLGVAALVTLPRWLGYSFAERGDVIGHVEPGFRNTANDIARFFREEAPKDSLVAALPVGHVGYYARNIRILDMWGLNDVH